MKHSGDSMLVMNNTGGSVLLARVKRKSVIAVGNYALSFYLILVSHRYRFSERGLFLILTKSFDAFLFQSESGE